MSGARKRNHGKDQGTGRMAKAAGNSYFPLPTATAPGADSTLQTGMIHLLKGISENIGLAEVLQEAFPSTYERIFALASFLVCCGEPVSHCADWMERSDIGEVGPMSSQRISELLHSVSVQERELFFSRWNRYRSDLDYLALEITSISSWSQHIDDVEWGYNRNGDKLPQINLCMLVGQQSYLPVRMMVYSGSIRDVSTLETTVSQLAPGCRDKVLIVMDKGFASRKNINMMLRKEVLLFLIALPFTLRFAKKQLEAERKDIDSVQNTIVSGSDILRGVSKKRAWGDGHKLFVHVFYNDMNAVAVNNNLYGRVRQLIEAAENDPNNSKLKPYFDRYLIIRSSSKNKRGYTINLREDVVAQELAHAGWLVTLSNHIQDAAQAITVYRAKDVIEKGFMRIKSSLGLDRLRVHSQQAMESKMFIGFIALIMLSHIHRVMLKKDLYKTMTMKGLMRTMEKQRTQVIDGRRILFPLSKKQKEIYNALDVSIPV